MRFENNNNKMELLERACIKPEVEHFPETYSNVYTMEKKIGLVENKATEPIRNNAQEQVRPKPNKSVSDVGTVNSKSLPDSKKEEEHTGCI